MQNTEIERVAHHLDRALARHGYLVGRAPEMVPVKVYKAPKVAGDHARFMLQEIPHILEESTTIEAMLKAQRWLRFAEGIVWALGVKTIMELQEVHEGEEGEVW